MKSPRSRHKGPKGKINRPKPAKRFGQREQETQKPVRQIWSRQSKAGSNPNNPSGVGPLSGAIVEYGFSLTEEAKADSISMPRPWLLKRVLDLAICIPALLMLSPFLALVAITIRMIDGGPVLYRAMRIGKDGVPFDCLKYRTMVVNAEALKVHLMKRNIHGKGITFKVLDDPRITWLGKIIRRWSIDELPQLWNVVRGEMTLVGPRPACPLEVARYSPADRDRLAVVPGLTCIWQVSGRCQVPFEKQVEMDRQYIQNQTFFYDLYLILRTIPAVVLGKGAY